MIREFLSYALVTLFLAGLIWGFFQLKHNSGESRQRSRDRQQVAASRKRLAGRPDPVDSLDPPPE